MRVGLAILFVSVWLTASASAAEVSPASAMLPTGEDARPIGNQPANQAQVPQPVQSENATHRSISLAPGVPRLSSRFGWRGDPLGQGTRFHSGVDIPAPSGAAVRAVRAGRVVFAGWAGSYGTMVEIDHGGGVHSRYGHLERASVAVGDLVSMRALVGAIGSTGRATGPHLHYEVRVAGMAVDPLRAAMTVRETGMPDLVWPGDGVEPAEALRRWSWQAEDRNVALPEPVIR